MPMIRGVGRLPTTPPPPIAIPAPLPPDYTPERLIDWQGVTAEYYQDEWGVWHDKEGRPRPASYVQAAMQRQPHTAPLADPDRVDLWLIGCTGCGKAVPECPCRYRRLARYTVPEGPWWYRVWVWCVIRIAG